MSKVKSLEELTDKEFNTLKESGMLKIIYPDAPDNFNELNPEVPVPIENPDFSSLIETCKSVMLGIEKNGCMDDDDDHYVYEAAMMAIYGKDVWVYINKKVR